MLSYNYRFFIRKNPILDHVLAKISRDPHAYKIENHEVFQLNFNFLHPTSKDVQCNKFKVHETKLMHSLIHYTYLKDNLHMKIFIYKRSTNISLFT